MINFPALYWVALDQQKTTSAKKEFWSKIKSQDACSHFYQPLEKYTADQQDRTVQAMMMK